MVPMVPWLAHAFLWLTPRRDPDAVAIPDGVTPCESGLATRRLLAIRSSQFRRSDHVASDRLSAGDYGTDLGFSLTGDGGCPRSDAIEPAVQRIPDAETILCGHSGWSVPRHCCGRWVAGMVDSAAVLATPSSIASCTRHHKRCTSAIVLERSDSGA